MSYIVLINSLIDLSLRRSAGSCYIRTKHIYILLLSNYCMVPLSELEVICADIRKEAFETILAANNGHVGASSSSVELLVSLYFNDILRYDKTNPRDPDRDRVLIRGHVGPLRYNLFSRLGWLGRDELKTYRAFGSRLKGHECMNAVPGVDITPSGSLGMLLSYGVGAAISAREQQKSFTTYVFLGDGEEQEGNVSEAARHAATIGLDNIVCIIDRNAKQLSGNTADADGASNLAMIWRGYGWDVQNILDGHDLSEIKRVFSTPRAVGKPTVIIARTIKGKDVPGCEESFNGYHTLSTCTKDRLETAIAQQQRLLNNQRIDVSSMRVKEIDAKPTPVRSNSARRIEISVIPDPNNMRNQLDAQTHYFSALGKLCGRNAIRTYFLSPDWVLMEHNAVRELMAGIRFYDVGIREQHIVAMAHGLSVSDPDARVIVNIGDFLSYRAADQINAAAQGDSNIIILADAAGLTQSRNGRTHQSVGQPAMIASMPGVSLYEPADVPDLYAVLNRLLSLNTGVNYVRTYRYNAPCLPAMTDRNTQYYTVRDSVDPKLTLIGSGLTTHLLLSAAEILSSRYGIDSRLLNVIEHKAVNSEFCKRVVPGRPAFMAYNGAPGVLQGRIASALLETGFHMPSVFIAHGFENGDTGSTDDLLAAYRLDAEGLISVIDERIGLQRLR